MRHCDILSGRGQDLRTTEVKVVSDPRWKRLFLALLFLVVGFLGEGAVFLDYVGLVSGRPSVIWWAYKSLGITGLFVSGFFVALALRGRVKDPDETEEEGK